MTDISFFTKVFLWLTFSRVMSVPIIPTNNNSIDTTRSKSDSFPKKKYVCRPFSGDLHGRSTILVGVRLVNALLAHHPTSTTHPQLISSHRLSNPSL